jgi:hypothetical protein
MVKKSWKDRTDIRSEISALTGIVLIVIERQTENSTRMLSQRYSANMDRMCQANFANGFLQTDTG